jgi:hypothetical protein
MTEIDLTRQKIIFTVTFYVQKTERSPLRFKGCSRPTSPCHSTYALHSVVADFHLYAIILLIISYKLVLLKVVYVVIEVCILW